MARRPARYLAPLALLATAVATAVIVSEATGSGHHPAQARRVARPKVSRTVAGGGRRAGAYVVQSGDTLSAIAAKTGVSVATLEALNPRVSPTALQTGQRLRLRR
jgi:LysM repeat protein